MRRSWVFVALVAIALGTGAVVMRMSTNHRIAEHTVGADRLDPPHDRPIVADANTSDGTGVGRREPVPEPSADLPSSKRLAELEVQLERFRTASGKDRFTEAVVLLHDCISIVLHPDGTIRLTSLSPGIPGTGDEITMTEQDGKMLVSVRDQFYCEWPVPSINGIYRDGTVELMPSVQAQIEKRAAEAIALLRANVPASK